MATGGAGDGAIGVLGAYGQTGRVVTAALRSRGRLVRSLSRSAAGSPDAARCDLTDPIPLIAKAMEGLSALYVIPPRLNPSEDHLAVRAFRAAELAGVRNVVFHSVMHPASSDVPHHTRKARAEEALRQSSLRWAIVQPNTYAQNYLTRVRAGAEGAELVCPWPVESPPLAPVDLLDIAAAATAVITRDDTTYGTFELAGPELLTHPDIAARFAEAWNHPVTAVEADPGFFVPDTVDAGAIRKASDTAAYHAHYAAHGMPGSPLILTVLLGRPPRSFIDVVRRELPDGQPPAR